MYCEIRPLTCRGVSYITNISIEIPLTILVFVCISNEPRDHHGPKTKLVTGWTKPQRLSWRCPFNHHLGLNSSLVCSISWTNHLLQGQMRYPPQTGTLASKSCLIQLNSIQGRPRIFVWRRYNVSSSLSNDVFIKTLDYSTYFISAL